MKKPLFLILVSLCLTLSSKAQDTQQLQIIVPVENEVAFSQSYSGSVVKNIYIKDVNHVLNKYLGTWHSTYEGKNYNFYITTYTEYRKKFNISLDVLLIHYKITTDSGEVLASTLGLSTENTKVIKGYGYADLEGQDYQAIYFGEQSECGDMGTLNLKMANSSQTEMQLYIEPYEALFTSADCPNGYVAPPFPQEDELAMILTKVE